MNNTVKRNTVSKKLVKKNALMSNYNKGDRKVDKDNEKEEGDHKIFGNHMSPHV